MTLIDSVELDEREEFAKFRKARSKLVDGDRIGSRSCLLGNISESSDSSCDAPVQNDRAQPGAPRTSNLRRTSVRTRGDRSEAFRLLDVHCA